jgi:hypothetical protein
MFLLLTQVVFFQDNHVFLQISWIALFGTKRTYLYLEKPSCRKYSFQKLTKFSQGINVLDVPHSNIDAFRSRDTCVSSTQLNNTNWNKMFVSPLNKTKLQEIFLSKTNSVLTGKQCARCPTFYHRWFSFESHMCFFNSAEYAYLEQNEGFSFWITVWQ